MHVMLADSIDGGLLVLLILFGVVVTSLLALGGLFPASRGHKSQTLYLIIPAFVLGVLVTLWLGYGYFADDMRNPDFEFAPDLLMPWMFLAGPAFATSLLGGIVLWSKSRNVK